MVRAQGAGEDSWMGGAQGPTGVARAQGRWWLGNGQGPGMVRAGEGPEMMEGPEMAKDGGWLGLRDGES